MDNQIPYGNACLCPTPNVNAPYMSTVMIVFVVNNALEVSTDIYTVVVTEAINRFAFNFDLVLKYGQIILPDY